MSKVERNTSIELYRCVLMFGICVLHSAITPGYGRVWLINLLCFCVDGFAFITGYYGCRFKPSKVIRLFLIGAFCALVCAKGDFDELVRIFGDYWFLHAYILMMVFAPLIDLTLEKTINLRLILPLLVAIFAWGFAPTLPKIGYLIPKTEGLANYSGLTLLGVYILGRLYRKLHLQERLNIRYVVFATVALAVLCALGLNEYNSPTAALLAGCCFFLFNGIKLNGFVSEVVNLLAPSVFAIYLLHQPGRLFSHYSFVKSWVDDGWNVYATYVIAGGIAFFGSVIVDIPRRLISKYAVIVGAGVMNALDDLWERWCNKLERSLS